MEQEGYKYYAFISYSHADQKIATKLQKRLEHYHLPSALRKSNPDLPKNLKPIFRDESDLVATGTLKSALQANLDRSNYLILICSPSSAKSEYVNDEVDYFIKNGRADHIVPFIVDGIPHSDAPALECFPPAILDLPREDELLGIDLKKFGLREAIVRVIATLLRLDIDDFVSRDLRERKRKALIFTSILIALMIIAIMLIPPSYDEVYADNVMQNALGAYVRSGQQYTKLSALTDCAINKPNEFPQELQLYRNQIPYTGMTADNAIQYLADMMATGKVMSWSRLPMRQHECEELLSLPNTREEDYANFATVLEYVMTDEYARRYYGSQYPQLLHELLEITAELFQIVCTPHLTGKYADHSMTAQEFESVFSVVSKQNGHLTGEDLKQSLESLSRLKGERSDILSRLNSCGVFEAYESAKRLSPRSADVVSVDVYEDVEESQPISGDQAKVRLLNDLLAYTYHCEIMYSDILWAIDALGSFDREKSWEALLSARAIVTIAKTDIQRRELPDNEMTPEDRRYFMQQGMDIDAFGNLSLIFDGERTALLNICSNLNNSLINGIFFNEDWRISMRNAENDREIIYRYIQHLAHTVDYVLTTLNDSSATAKFNRLLEEHCPLTYARKRKQPDALAAIEADLQANLDSMEPLVMESSRILGAHRNRLNLMIDAIDKGNLGAFTQDLTTISDLPPVVPFPKGMSIFKTEYLYMWKENDKVIASPSPRTKLPRVPDTYRVRINDISLEEAKEYMQDLVNLGLSLLLHKDEATKLTSAYSVGDSRFAVIWENEKLDIFILSNMISLVPQVYWPIVSKF